ncbi:MAG: hypothetical protein JWO89_930, partial [Verrucomicrobiaceae bacterium]|nr:hypothetical protein [Verrucomicrobiaceae bacterium]
SSTNETQRRLLEYIRDSAVQKFDATVFVLCFSDKHDDLNQCRSYASPGNGYCIGYQSASLKMFAAYNRARLGKCVYSGEKQEEVVNQLVAFFLDDLMGYFPFFGPGELNEGLIEKRAVLFWRYFQQVAPLFKHPAFAEEEEARIVLHLPATSKDIKFRSGPMSIVPYVSLRQL